MPSDKKPAENSAASQGFVASMLAMPNDSIQKTIFVAVVLCLVCAIFVSGAAVALRPLQERNKALDMKVNILSVAGLLESSGSVDEIFANNIVTRIVDIRSGEYVDSVDPEQYDQRKAAKDASMNISIPADQDIASIKTQAKYAEVYLVKKDGKLDSIILPVHGYGLWSTMYGFIALEPDAQTVAGINFYDQAETPGLGGEVVNPLWQALWKGKKIYDDAGEPQLHLVKGNVDAMRPGAEHMVDGLAGATLTSRGVSNLVKYWMGKQGFAPFLNKIRAERG